MSPRKRTRQQPTQEYDTEPQSVVAKRTRASTIRHRSGKSADMVMHEMGEENENENENEEEDEDKNKISELSKPTRRSRKGRANMEKKETVIELRKERSNKVTHSEEKDKDDVDEDGDMKMFENLKGHTTSKTVSPHFSQTQRDRYPNVAELPLSENAKGKQREILSPVTSESSTDEMHKLSNFKEFDEDEYKLLKSDHLKEKGKERQIFLEEDEKEESNISKEAEDETLDDGCDDDEDEMEWEDIPIPPSTNNIDNDIPEELVIRDITITIEGPNIEPSPRGTTKMDRIIRRLVHCTHTLTLLAHYRIRSQHISDPILFSAALSLSPPDLKDALTTKDSTIEYLSALVGWWRKKFFVTNLGMQARRWEDFGIRGTEGVCISGTDVIEGGPSGLVYLLRDRQAGDRDTSAMLFTAICRAVGVEARLVVSLQVVDFRIENSRNKGDSLQTETDIAENMEEGEGKVSENNTNADISSSYESPVIPTPAPPPTSRVSRRRPRASIFPKDSPDPVSSTSLIDTRSLPPTVWTEVWSPAHNKYIPIDPIRGIIDQPECFEPHKISVAENVMAYVLAFEHDNDGVRDVTRRYVKTRFIRSRPKGGNKWWANVMNGLKRQNWRDRDDSEDTLLSEVVTLAKENMPTTLAAMHNHPLYALDRHIKKFEIIYPRKPVVGHIRGEPVFPRSCVKQLHTAETWLKEGRSIKEKEQPLKYVKARVMTIEKKRKLEMNKMNDQEIKAEVGVYGEWQTEEYKPGIVVDGIIPKNAYGNVDLFKPSMCPIGAVHMPLKGAGKIAKKLGIDYADAIVGFDFQSRRCVPVIDGIVVPIESEQIILDAFHENQHNEFVKESSRREQAIVARWKKLLLGLQVTKRLAEEYGNGGDGFDEMMVETYQKID